MRIREIWSGRRELSQAANAIVSTLASSSGNDRQAESEHAQCMPTKRSVKHPGAALPANLLASTDSALHADSARVQTLRQETVVIGYEESSHLDVEPASTCAGQNEEGLPVVRGTRSGLSITATRSSEVPGDDRIVIDTIVSKYCNHTRCMARA